MSERVKVALWIVGLVGMIVVARELLRRMG